MSLSKHFRSTTILFVLIANLSMGIGCGETAGTGEPTEEPQAGELLKSEKQRITSPDVSDDDLLELVAGNSQFAVDLYHQLVADEEGNVFYSPLSISIALAMTYAGAEGDTASEMAETLHFTLEESRLHPAFNALDLQLESRGEGAQGRDGEGFRLNVVNQLWGQTGYPFKDSYLDVIAENYGAGLRLLDFSLDPEEARTTINDWVSYQTEGRIEELLKEGVLTDLTRLVLTNAIYFNAAWSLVFPDDSTAPGDFYLLGGDSVSAQMMHQTEIFNYARGEGYQAVELLYDGEEMSMVVLLPEAGEFESFEEAMTAALLDSIIGEIEPYTVALSLPKFEFTSDFSLKEVLIALGMPTAFDDSLADFSAMHSAREILYIAHVIHQAFVSVDEAGTEAAAATAVIMEGRGAPEPYAEMTVERPFIFLIRDIPTGSILFIGRVLEPSEG